MGVWELAAIVEVDPRGVHGALREEAELDVCRLVLAERKVEERKRAVRGGGNGDGGVGAFGDEVAVLRLEQMPGQRLQNAAHHPCDLRRRLLAVERRTPRVGFARQPEGEGTKALAEAAPP